MTILSVIGGVLSILYGILNIIGGSSQLRIKKIQEWASWLMILFGLLLIVAGAIAILRNPLGLYLLIVGLVGIHIMAIQNGLKLFRKINPSHHLVRLAVSLVLAGLVYWSLIR